MPSLFHRGGYKLPDKPFRSIRLKEFDYSQAGSYFITICTFNRACLFGEVYLDNMNLNQLGEIVSREWKRTEELRKNVVMDAFIVMPNHLHGIISIVEGSESHTETASSAEAFGKPTSNSIPTIVRLFKASTTTQINSSLNMKDKPVWQRNYYEHVIRGERDLEQIREYITYNASKWDSDNENPRNIKK